MNKLKSFLFFKPLEAIFFWKCKLPIELSILKELCSTFVKSLGNRSNFGHISNVYTFFLSASVTLYSFPFSIYSILSYFLGITKITNEIFSPGKTISVLFLLLLELSHHSYRSQLFDILVVLLYFTFSLAPFLYY